MALYLINTNCKKSMKNKEYAQNLNWIDAMHDLK